MAAEEHILGNIVRVGLLYKEGVLHIAGWVVGSKVEHRKYVLVVILSLIHISLQIFCAIVSESEPPFTVKS